MCMLVRFELFVFLRGYEFFTGESSSLRRLPTISASGLALNCGVSRRRMTAFLFGRGSWCLDVIEESIRETVPDNSQP